MEVKAFVFRKFYELLRDKFIQEFCPEFLENKESLDVWDKKFKEPDYSANHPFYKQNIAHVLFDVNEKGDYFYEKYLIAVTNPDKFKIWDHRMYRALRYFNESKRWTAELHAKYSKLSKPQEKEQADLWLAEFEKDFVTPSSKPHPKEKDSNSKQDNISGAIEKLITEFFAAITEKNYDVAWKLLSPELKKKSFWEDSFDRFRASFLGIAATKPFFFGDFLYGTNRVDCRILFKEEGNLADIQKLNSYAVQDTNEGRACKNAMKEIADFLHRHNWDRKDIHEDELFNFVEYFDWINNTKSFSLERNIIRKLKYQKLFHFYEPNIPTSIRNEIINQNELRYKLVFSTDLSCIFSEGSWLINNVKIVDCTF